MVKAGVLSSGAVRPVRLHLSGFFFISVQMVEEKYDCVFVCVAVSFFICKSLLQLTDI